MVKRYGLIALICLLLSSPLPHASIANPDFVVESEAQLESRLEEFSRDFAAYDKGIDRSKPEWWRLRHVYCERFVLQHSGVDKSVLKRIAKRCEANSFNYQSRPNSDMTEHNRLPTFESVLYNVLLEIYIRNGSRAELVKALSVYAPDSLLGDDFEYWIANSCKERPKLNPSMLVFADALAGSTISLTRVAIERIIRRAYVGCHFSHESGVELIRGARGWHSENRNAMIDERYANNREVREEGGLPVRLYKTNGEK